ncbi:MAG: hypothetical protein ACE5IK_02490 [Acidobacteriota bacterium]
MTSSASGLDANPVIVHENLTLLETEGPEQMEDLQLVPEVRAALVRQIDPCTAVVDARRLDTLLAALRKHGHLPRVLDDATGAGHAG